MPIIWSQKLENEGELAVWKISETAEELYEQLQLNDAEREHFNSLNKGARHMHWLGSRVLLRTMLNTPLFINFQLDEFNKPYLVNFPFEISISHSNDMAAVMMYQKKKVGIDIEKMSEKILRIKQRFLSEEELLFIDEQHEIEHLYVCWGIKESLFKLYGKGNLPFIHGIKIYPFNYKKSNQAKARIITPSFEQEFEIEYLKIEGYMLTWVKE